MAMDNAIALGIQPLKIDVATPLMQAAKIKEMQAETQQRDIQMRREAIGAEARGLAPYFGTPEFDAMHSASRDRLIGQGILNTPQAVNGFDTELRHPLGIQSIIARSRTQAEDLAERGFGLKSQEFTEAKRHAGVIEGQGQQKIELEGLTPKKIGEDMNGDIFGVRDPSAPGGYRRVDVRSMPTAPAIGAALQPGGPQPAVTPGAVPTAPGAPSTAAVPGAVSPPGVPAAPKTERQLAGQKYLDENFPKENHTLIERVADYEVNPQTVPMKQRTKILTAAANLAAARGETYDQANYAMRSETMKAFAKGKQGDAVRSFNVGIEHLDQLGELGKALDNGDIPKLNALKNWVKTNLGQDAPTNFNGLKAVVGAEIVKAIVGAGGGVEERATAARTVADASSPAQLAGIIKTYQGAMGAQLGGLERQYETGTLRKDFRHKLSPAAVRMIEAHEKGGAAGTPAAGDAAAPRKTSTGITYTIEP